MAQKRTVTTEPEAIVDAETAVKKTVSRTSRTNAKTQTTVAKVKASPKPKNKIVCVQNDEGNDVPVRIHDNTKPKQPAVVSGRMPLQLALLSPFRFPVPHEQFVAATARIAGVLMVVIGAVLTMVNMQYVGATFPDANALPAQLTDATSADQTGTTGTSANIDTTPAPRIAVSGGTEMKEKVSITTTVPNATAVSMVALLTTTAQDIPLGNAVRKDDTNWQFTWDTLTHGSPNGTYKFRVVITNQYGTYSYTDATLYTLVNTITDGVMTHTETITSTQSQTTTGDVATTTDAGVATTISTTTPPVDTPVPTVTLSILSDKPLKGTVPILGTAVGATEFKVYVQSATVKSYIGPATQASTGEWKISWDTTKMTDGAYKILGVAKINGVVYTAVADTKVFNTATSATALADTPVVPDATLQPKIDMLLSKTSTLTGPVDVYVTTSPVAWVEVFALPKNSLTPLFLGLAQKVSDTSWKFVWLTKQTPNGDYELYVRVKSTFGFTEGAHKSVRVQNEVMTQVSELEEAQIETLKLGSDALVREVNEVDSLATPDASAPKMQETRYVQPVPSFVETVAVTPDVQDALSGYLLEFRKKLSVKLDALAQAKRASDDEAVAKIKKEIIDMKNTALLSLPQGVEKKEIVDSIDVYLSQISFELQELTINNETILKERVGDAILKDSDKDEISDYDEINLYKTSPFSADTDGDGYIDSAEIKLGFNPHDERSEALVTYASPKESGIVREDLLVIHSITPIAPDQTDADEGKASPKAMIAGRGLPNSFVTLYIFSTPIVVTVKTTADGSWQYIFDKEIEDGAHEVYVGMTDNAGHIVAKSSPLPFVKTAEAFTSSGAPVAQVVEDLVPAPSLTEGRTLLVVASLAIVSLGLVLLLLGFHVRDRRMITSDVVPA